jgi:hypothetical protein
MRNWVVIKVSAVLCVIWLGACTADPKSRLVKDVLAEDPKVRQNAIIELKARPDREVLTALSQRLKTGNVQMERRAGRALLEVIEDIKQKKEKQPSGVEQNKSPDLPIAPFAPSAFADSAAGTPPQSQTDPMGR